MFNILYLFLYKYIYLCKKENNSAFFIENKNCFNINNNVLFNKKKNIFFLKKRLFFFKFLLNPVRPLVHGLNKKKRKKSARNENIFFFNSVLKKKKFSLLKDCFRTIASKRPVRNLYYRISRSRNVLVNINNSLRSNKNINYFVKKTHNMYGFSKKKETLLCFKSPLLNYCLLSSLKFSKDYYKLFYSFKRKWKRPDWDILVDYFRRTRRKKNERKMENLKKSKNLSQKAFRYGRLKPKYRAKRIRIPKHFTKPSRNTRSLNSVLKGYRIKFFSFFYKSKLFRKYYYTRSKKMAVTFFLYRNLGKLFIRSNNKYYTHSSKFLNEKNIFFSDITGLSLKEKSNSFNNIKKCPVKSKFINIYNIKTYNWLITI